MTRLQIRSMVRKALGETTSAFWSDDELNGYINFGCKDLAWRTKCLRSSGTIGSISCVSTTVSLRSNEYSISSYFPTAFAINEVYFKVDGQRFMRLEPTSREELDIENPNWQALVGYTTVTNTGTAAVTTYNVASQPGIPYKYYWSREEDVFGIYPPPNDAQSGADYIKVYYSYNHTDISGDSDSPSLPNGLHLAIVDFAVARGLEDRGWGDRANDAWGKYFSKIKDYGVEKKNEREDDEIIMKNYRNI